MLSSITVKLWGYVEDGKVQSRRHIQTVPYIIYKLQIIYKNIVSKHTHKFKHYILLILTLFHHKRLTYCPDPISNV